MRTKLIFLLVCIAATPLALVSGYRFNCNRHEAAFQARFNELKRDAVESIKIGSTREDALRFFSQKGLRVSANQSESVAWLWTSRGCGRSWACSIGPDGGEISISVTFDEHGTVNSNPIVTAKYAGDCS
jgi:hypothetical protein